MKKIIRLTESDLTRIVKRVIKEGESEEIYMKLVEKLEDNGFKDDGTGDFLAGSRSNDVEVRVQFSQGLYIYLIVSIDGVGYARERGALYKSINVDKAIEVNNMIKRGDNKNTIKKYLQKNGFTTNP